MFEGNTLTNLVDRLRAVFVGIGSITDLLQINKLKTTLIYPPTDSTTAVQITKADGTTGVLTVDTSNKRVGVVGTSPSYHLHVSDSVAANGPVRIAATNTNSAGDGDIAAFNDAGNYIISQIWGTASTGSSFGIARNSPLALIVSDSIFGVGTLAAKYMLLGTNSTERARITSNGAVLVGKTSSNASDTSGMLEVNNNAIVGSAFGTEPVGNYPIEAHTSAAGNGIVAFNTFTAGSASGGIIRAAYGGIPSAADQRLGLLIFGATSTGSTQTSTAGISGWSAELWDNTHAGAYLRLETTATASTSRTERLRVTAAGATRIGGGAMTNTDAAGNLEVTGATFLLSDTTIADAKNIILSATTGTQIGTATTQKIGFYGTAPTAQRANANQAAAPAGGTGATAGAYDTAAHRDALINLVNEMRTVLINLGLMKGSA